MRKRSILGAAIAVVASVALSGTVLAASFTNGSFENTTNTFVNAGQGFMTLPAASTTIPGWTVGGNGVDWISTYWNAEAGSYSLDMNSTAAGSISQTFDTVAGATYTVGFWQSGNPACGAGTKTLTVQATGGTVGTYSYDVTSHLTPSGYPFTISWTHEEYTFTASGTSTTLTFTSTTTGACGPALDNVTLSQASTTGASCKDGGWKSNTYVDSQGNALSFKNQGACVSYFATHGQVPIGR